MVSLDRLSKNRKDGILTIIEGEKLRITRHYKLSSSLKVEVMKIE